MTRFYSVVLLLAIIFSSLQLTAQDTPPVHFSFSAHRDVDQKAFVLIKAKVSRGMLFSAIKKTPDDMFLSSVNFDTAARKFIIDSLQENGNIKNEALDATGGVVVRYTPDSVEWRQPLNIPATDSLIVKGSVVWLVLADSVFLNEEVTFDVQVPAAPSRDEGKKEEKEETLATIFWICLGTGLLAVFTPCVFPLVPVTVSFFLKKGKTRAEGVTNALWYSISIILIYTIPTIILTLIFGDKILYTISTHPVSNLFFFVIFIIFAISFFGAFELTLPNSWANKADEKAGKGGFFGIFFMALTLVIVSFSCTGPIVGSLLGKTAAEGVGLAPVLGMLGFGLGLALPFSLFAFFPSMLKSLPKSGGWLNTVKVTFGFIELALALKFLSNVDLAYHWRLLDREVFLVFWIIIFLLLGFYLLGKLKFSHDSDLPYITVPRLFFAIASFSFALYMFPGLWGAPLKGIGGWLPHTSTQDFNLHELKYKLEGLKGTTSSSGSSASAALPPKKLTDKLHAPLGLVSYFDLEEGMAAAKALNKPVMLDFTGHSCANCRKMEAEVWDDPEVLKLLRDDFVLVSLYVDESTDLPMNERYVSKDGVNVTTVGQKNLDYEITKFGFNAQPLYMFLDLNGVPLSNEKIGYVSKEVFVNHLKKVKQEFANRTSNQE
ncbi:protein-disulfide reductase DsbD family protein [Aridibaculum aurantiacum]|uniref:protein-disulfide reductase DsbD family protein n=1 Tax=Aridibaculum aurantiacum TaxID=2810307 RepID=UPI001A96FE2F|nr:cytochrome c biogenesis protein CcdA [Aridibaculum aurantiacum]